ncbi:MAG TPA: aliphatic sulfonate ABC transporter substrate-binding protein [Niallia sp.]|nr:aliphatic sulfonate ABC transporter substrate-binding protein [Niallia sp.]
MKKKLWTISSVLLIVLSVFLSACGADKTSSSSKKEDIVVHIGIQGKTGVLPYAREHGYFEKAFEKEGVKVEWSEFASGPPHFEALSAGRLDFGSVGGSPIIAGQAAGIDFKAIGVTSDGTATNAIVIPKDSSVKEIADLKGKKVGVAKGSSGYNFLFLALDTAGLTDKDIELIQLQPDEARPALDNGSIDAWAIWDPYVTTAVYQTGAKVLVSGEDLGIMMPSFLIARTKFTEEHADLTELFLKTYEEVRQYYVEHIDEISEEVAKSQKVDVEIIKTVLEKTDTRLSPTTPEYQKAHQDQADFLYSVGGIDKKLDTSKVIANEFVEKALKAE